MIEILIGAFVFCLIFSFICGILYLSEKYPIVEIITSLIGVAITLSLCWSIGTIAIGYFHRTGQTTNKERE